MGNPSVLYVHNIVLFKHNTQSMKKYFRSLPIQWCFIFFFSTLLSFNAKAESPNHMLYDRYDIKVYVVKKPYTITSIYKEQYKLHKGDTIYGSEFAHKKRFLVWDLRTTDYSYHAIHEIVDIDQIIQAEGKGVIDQINISFWEKRVLFHTLANDYWKAVNWFVWTLVAVIIIFLVWLIKCRDDRYGGLPITLILAYSLFLIYFLCNPEESWWFVTNAAGFGWIGYIISMILIAASVGVGVGLFQTRELLPIIAGILAFLFVIISFCQLWEQSFWYCILIIYFAIMGLVQLLFMKR